MNHRSIPNLTSAVVVLTLLAGCATSPESHLVTAPPPPAPTSVPQQVVVVAQPLQVAAPAAVPVNSYIVVQAPPTPPPPEAVPERPSSRHVWIAGHWTWQANRYAWMAGRWEVPPYSTAVWINPRSEAEGGAFRFYEGYWK